MQNDCAVKPFVPLCRLRVTEIRDDEVDSFGDAAVFVGSFQPEQDPVEPLDPVPAVRVEGRGERQKDERSLEAVDRVGEVGREAPEKLVFLKVVGGRSGGRKNGLRGEAVPADDRV